jgi:phosphoenolpyruvate phosphomutase
MVATFIQPAPSKSSRLRSLLYSAHLEFLMEAHNGISARIVEEVGFKGIWASGLAISAQYGVRDNNEASWTQVVDLLEFMSDVTHIPILLDGDTGYGNFNNMRRLVRKLEQREIAGVCIEDKVFPKKNSFIDGHRQQLCDIEEFCGKIKAGKDSQWDPEFCIVARVEALIAGWGLDEALRRAEAYHDAGADAILVHSKLSRPDEILAFAKRWENRLPLIIVPTKYYSTPTEIFRKAGISVTVWANHMIRASVAAMQETAQEVFDTQTLTNVEDGIATVDEIFRLQGADELARAEMQYFIRNHRKTRAIVLAATRGQGLESVTEERPKVMLTVAGKPLLQRLVDTFKQHEIHRITVVGGYKAESIDVSGIHVVNNPNFAHSGELVSLTCALNELGEDTIITYGDLLFRQYILRDLLDSRGEMIAVVDSALPSPQSRNYRDLAFCSRPNDYALFAQDVNLLKVVSRPEHCEQAPSGLWMGMMRVQGDGRKWLLEALTQLQNRPDFNTLGLPDLLNHLLKNAKPIKVLYIHGHWLDVNNLEDLGRASDFTHGA